MIPGFAAGCAGEGLDGVAAGFAELAGGVAGALCAFGAAGCAAAGLAGAAGAEPGGLCAFGAAGCAPGPAPGFVPLGPPSTTVACANCGGGAALSRFFTRIVMRRLDGS